MWLFWCFIIGIIIGIIRYAANSSNRTNEKNSQDRQISSKNITKTADYSYTNSNQTASARFVVDNQHEKIHVASASNLLIDIPFSEIIGCETFSDNQTCGGVGRAIAGGILAGGVGAIVGSNTAKSKITSYYVLIYRDNISRPQVRLDLIVDPTNISSMEYKNAVSFSNDVSASIKAILNRRANQSLTVDSVPRVHDKSIEAIKKYKELLDIGVISAEEFEEKKKFYLNEIESENNAANNNRLSDTIQNNSKMYKVILERYNQSDKIQIVKTVREITGLGLAEAKELVESAPISIMENVSKDEAEGIKEQFSPFDGCVSVNEIIS